MQRLRLLTGCFAATGVLLIACGAPAGVHQTIWEGRLVGVVPGLSGSVAAVAMTGRTTVELQIHGATAAPAYAWRINRGSCGTEGEIMGGVAIYPALRPDDSGEAAARAVLSRELISGNGYAVRLLHVDAAGFERTEACGTLEEVR